MRPQCLGTACLTVCLLGVVTNTSAQSSLDHDVALAESLYAVGNVEVPLQILSASMDKAADEYAPRIYRLLILLYQHEGDSTQAATTAVQLLYRVPGYEPDSTNDPPAYVTLMRDTRALLLSPDRNVASCEQELASAAAHYTEGAYEEATTVLSECLNREFVYLPETEYVPALRLLALVNVKAGNLPKAKDAVTRLLKLKPDYSADPVQDPPGYVALVGIVKSVQQQ